MFLNVIINIANKNVDTVYTYKVDDKDIPNWVTDYSDLVGYRVIVPFGRGNTNREGYVVSITDTVSYDIKKVKSVTKFPDKYRTFTDRQIRLAGFIKQRYFCTTFDGLKLMKPIGVTIDSDMGKNIRVVSIDYENENIDILIDKVKERDSKQSDVLYFLEQNEKAPFTYIKEYFSITNAPIDALIKKGILKVELEEVRRQSVSDYALNQTRSQKKELTFEQQSSFDTIMAEYKKEVKKPILLHGVTGSGKTEIYLQIIEEVIKEGKSAIVLVPEISLTPQVVNIFVSRFPEEVSVTHSRLSIGERYDQWKKARDSEISIMIGPRSCLFTPFESIGAIIIDEEHESTYKSDTTPKYDSIEVAKQLALEHNALLVLGSATPRLSSYKEALDGDLILVKMLNRVNNSFPENIIVDMRDELKNLNRSIFSYRLQEEMMETLNNDKQIILFLNRRGFSNYVCCRECGYTIECQSCNVNYTYHKYNDRLICHYCNDTIKNPTNCPQCGSKHIRPFGIGTQRVEEEVLKLFPHENVLRMDLDTTSKKNSHDEILSMFRQKKSRILIGTQMIAKGLDFPDVTLVGIVASDLSLHNGDYRGAETTFSLLTQVAGRSGRSENAGKVIIQTYNKEHYAIVCASKNDYESFYEEEISLRRQMDYPPWTNIFIIMFTSTDEKRIIILLHRLVEIMNFYNKKGFFTILNPSPLVISKVKNKYRWKVMVKGENYDLLVQFALFSLDKLKKTDQLSDMTISLNINPNMML